MTSFRPHLTALAPAAFRIRDERSFDVAPREALLDTAFGAGRFAKTCERLREGRRPAEGLALVAEDRAGRLIGTVRLWHVEAGEAGPSLMLGPIAVAAAARSLGLGGALMRAAIARAGRLGHRSILLVGDAAWYARFGFAPDLTLGLDLPGPVERARFLGLELVEGALAEARGLVVATGRPLAAVRAA
ncbi:N-acetyltransferase [Siculibacillus lacustris]|uniref:N-acetyltransferase n=1 Tax=Siculibacillus lacustris TaxID=1549641 RepID=A0A4Q9VXU8_9HYPH|nr:N-acetyltransferase [Siculibacillus lacustris]TBW40764.1 N-acetyltransferase [Siculibacillus lacustris]